MTLPSPSPAAQPHGPALRDIHLPPQPAWWPPAPGWWVVMGLALAVVAIAAWWWLRRRHRRMRIAAIVAEVDTLVAMHRGHAVVLAGQLHQLLRRAARRYDARATQYRGDAWHACLAVVPVSEEILQQLRGLDDAMYRPNASLDMSVAADATRQWLLAALEHGKVPLEAPRRVPRTESARA